MNILTPPSVLRWMFKLALRRTHRVRRTGGLLFALRISKVRAWDVVSCVHSINLRLVTDNVLLGPVQLLSPTFMVYTGSEWQSRVAATWDYLETFYKREGREVCSTCISIAPQVGMDLGGMKRLAQGVIHFEPAFDALTPSYRRTQPREYFVRGNPELIRNNWLDSVSFAPKEEVGLSQ
jgi:hypothetical protein